MFAHRNLPQLILQSVYLSGSRNFDVFIFSAMLFSCLSAIISLFQQISRMIRVNAQANDRPLDLEENYTNETRFLIKIDYNQVKPYHIFIHQLIGRHICQVLNIDYFTGDIDVFYILLTKTGIVAYINGRSIGRDLYCQLLTIEEKGSNINHAFCNELGESLNLAKNVIDSMTISIYKFDDGKVADHSRMGSLNLKQQIQELEFEKQRQRFERFEQNQQQVNNNGHGVNTNILPQEKRPKFEKNESQIEGKQSSSSSKVEAKTSLSVGAVRAILAVSKFKLGGGGGNHDHNNHNNHNHLGMARIEEIDNTSPVSLSGHVSGLSGLSLSNDNYIGNGNDKDKDNDIVVNVIQHEEKNQDVRQSHAPAAYSMEFGKFNFAKSMENGNFDNVMRKEDGDEDENADEESSSSSEQYRKIVANQQ